MDKETARELIRLLGGSVTAQGSSGLSPDALEIADLLDLDFKRMNLDEEIDALIRDPYASDEKTEALMSKSQSWRLVAYEGARYCEFDLETIKEICTELSDNPGAYIIKDEHGKWEFWVKVGPEHPVYQSLKRKGPTSDPMPKDSKRGPLCAILVRDCAVEYLAWDFGTFDGTNWHSFANGLITGLTKEVAQSVELPDVGE